VEPGTNVPGIARRGLSPLALKSGPSFEEIAKKYKLSDEQKRTYAQRKMTGEAYFRGLKAEEQIKILGPGLRTRALDKLEKWYNTV